MILKYDTEKEIVLEFISRQSPFSFQISTQSIAMITHDQISFL